MILLCLQSQYCSLHFAKMTTFLAQASASQFYTPAQSMYPRSRNYTNDSILSVVPAMFHIFCKDDISFFQAQASASRFYIPAHSMYQELQITLSSSFLSSGAVLFHTFCKDDNISLSQAQASASQFYTPAHSMYQEVEIILSGSIYVCSPRIVPYILHS